MRHPDLFKGRKEHDIDWLSFEAAQVFGRLPEAFEIVVAGDRRREERLDGYARGRGAKGVEWKSIKGEQKNDLPLFFMKNGEFDSPVKLSDFSRKVFTAFAEKIDSAKNKARFNTITYAATLQMPEEPKPEFLIAKVWDEVLGSQAVPFESQARQQLIERGRTHPDLKRHIEKWELTKAKA